MYILFGILLSTTGTHNYFVRYNTPRECIKARIYMENTYGTNNFSGFCTKEVK